MADKIKLVAKVAFTNPKTGLRLKVGDVLNVGKSTFWLRRLKAGDCEVYSAKKDAPKEEPKKLKAKGSK